MNVCLFGLVSEQFYAYWVIGMWSCCFFTISDDRFRRLQGLNTLEVGRYFPELFSYSYFRRLFVIAQFVAVAFQSLMYVFSPISCQILGFERSQLTRMIASMWHLALDVL